MIDDSLKLRPSERLIQQLDSYFSKQGYTYNKNHKEFRRPFPKGFQSVGFQFRISTFVSVHLFWSVHFERLEKLVAHLSKSKRYKTNWTIAENMPNFTRSSGIEYTFPLYDPTTLEYSNTSIKLAAEKLIDNYEQVVQPYFTEYDYYKTLETYINSFLLKEVRGLILAKYVDNPYYEKFFQILYDQIERRSGTTSEEMKIFIRTVQFLKTNDIIAFLD